MEVLIDKLQRQSKTTKNTHLLGLAKQNKTQPWNIPVSAPKIEFIEADLLNNLAPTMYIAVKFVSDWFVRGIWLGYFLELK